MPPATHAADLHPLLAHRTSPRGLDPDHALDDEDLALLLEAARWAPSSSNTQPWRFLVGRRDDDAYRAIEASLAAGNRTWAARASALVVAVAEHRDASGAPRTHAVWDTGQSVAHLTVQAGALGLAVRQIGGFSPAAIRTSFAIPDSFEPLTVVAIGRQLPEEALPREMAEAAAAPRVRKPLEQIAFSAWGTPLALRSSAAA